MNLYIVLQTVIKENSCKEGISSAKTNVHLPAFYIVYSFCLMMTFDTKTFIKL